MTEKSLVNDVAETVGTDAGLVFPDVFEGVAVGDELQAASTTATTAAERPAKRALRAFMTPPLAGADPTIAGFVASPYGRVPKRGMKVRPVP